MKKATLFFAVMGLLLCSFAQQNNSSMKYDRLLYQTLSAEEIAKMETEAPSKLADINFDLTHYCYVSDKLPETYVMAQEISTCVSPNMTCNIAEIVASKSINRFHYVIPGDAQRYTVYPVGNTGFYVIVNPTDVFVKEKQAYMKKMGF